MTADVPVFLDAATLAKHLAAARSAWPSLEFSEHAYVAWLQATLAEFEDPLAQLAKADAGIALLCWTAAHGDAEAHRLFELHFMPHVAPALARFGSDRDFDSEIAQRVRLKFFISEPGELAPIVLYALRGNLIGLVRVAAVREAINARRSDKPAAPIESIEQLTGDRDPALRALKVKYAVDFERAFTAAVAELSARDRQLLRLSLSVKASIDDIAKMFQTHRATAARWLNSARDELAAGTRRHLQAALKLPDDELMSLLRLVRTEATRMMASIPPEADA